jgi:hypothetical protein
MRQDLEAVGVKLPQEALEAIESLAG